MSVWSVVLPGKLRVYGWECSLQGDYRHSPGKLYLLLVSTRARAGNGPGWIRWQLLLTYLWSRFSARAEHRRARWDADKTVLCCSTWGKVWWQVPGVTPTNFSTCWYV